MISMDCGRQFRNNWVVVRWAANCGIWSSAKQGFREEGSPLEDVLGHLVNRNLRHVESHVQPSNFVVKIFDLTNVCFVVPFGCTAVQLWSVGTRLGGRESQKLRRSSSKGTITLCHSGQSPGRMQRIMVNGPFALFGLSVHH